jgi:hypothetical protein
LLPWWGMNCIPWCCLEYLHFHQERCKVLCFTLANSCPSSTFLLIFLLVSWHRVIKWWHLHLGQCVHYRSHSNKFGFMHYFISWDGNEDDDLCKETTLPQLAPNEYVFSLCHRSFYCLHQQMNDFFHWCANMMWVAKATSGPPLAIYMPSVKAKGVDSFVESSCHLYFEACCWCKWGFFQMSRPFLFCIAWPLMGGSVTQVVHLPLCDPLWVLLLWLELGVLLGPLSVFVLSFPLCWVLSLMTFARISLMSFVCIQIG